MEHALIHMSGAGALGDSGKMHLARFPNRVQESPMRSDWAKILLLKGTSLVLEGTLSAQLALWKDEISRGGDAWTHGLWVSAFLISIHSKSHTEFTENEKMMPMERHVLY